MTTQDDLVKAKKRTVQSVPVKKRVSRVLAKIRARFPGEYESGLVDSKFIFKSPEAEFMFNIVACAVEDGFLKPNKKRNRKAISSAKRYLLGDIRHAEICDVRADWIRKVLARYGLDVNAIPDSKQSELDFLARKLSIAIGKVKDEHMKYYIAVTYNGDVFKVVKNGDEQWEAVTSVIYPYRVGVYSHEASTDTILDDARRKLDEWHGCETEGA